jgi:uncharacterized protein YqeY
MSLFETIEKDYVQAYKAKDAVRLSVLRMLKTAVSNRLVEMRRPGGKLDDAEMLEVLVKEGKQRQDSIDQFAKAGRTDLADKETAELAVLRGYLPNPLTEAEVAEMVESTVTALGATSLKDMGRVMSDIMARCKGRVDGKSLSDAVRRRLG